MLRKISNGLILAAVSLSMSLSSTPAGATIVSDWNSLALAEVRLARLGPPIVARALAIAHTCMYDAWAAYDPRAVGIVVGASLRRPDSEHTDGKKSTAISFAAYRCLVNLFPGGASRLAAAMTGFGYDPNDQTTDTSTARGIGNVVAAAIIANRRNDGANQYGDLAAGAYADYTGYAARNPPLPFCTPQTIGPCPPNITDPNHWQPLISNSGSVQTFIAPHWERVRPFALSSASQFDNQPGIAPPPNYLQGPADYASDVDELLRYSSQLDLHGKLIVEYWADGPASELPPGHWGLFAQFVSQRDHHTIDQDVKLFFALHNASFDAGIVAWHMKRKYDGVRPITGIRHLKQGTQVLAWGGPGRPSEWIPGEKWTPYNPGSNLTPAFPGYVSGHSTFSSASAKILQSFTGSDYFGFSTVIPPNFGRVEPAIPPVASTLSYPTFSAAASEAGLSRLYGGIHFADDNTVGQTIGTLIGQQAWSKSQFHFDGGLTVDNTSTFADDETRTVLVWPHTVSARSNRLLLVGISYGLTRQPVVSVTYNGTALVRLGAADSPGSQSHVELWYTRAPAEGTASVVVTLPKKTDVVVGAMSFDGVDQNAPFGTFRSATGQSKSACVTLANASAPLVAMILAGNVGGMSVTVGPGQTAAWNAIPNPEAGEILATGVTAPGAPNATLCQTLGTATPWSVLAVPLNPAVAP